jgi:hypothetical protein
MAVSWYLGTGVVVSTVDTTITALVHLSGPALWIEAGLTGVLVIGGIVLQWRREEHRHSEAAMALYLAKLGGAEVTFNPGKDGRAAVQSVKVKQSSRISTVGHQGTTPNHSGTGALAPGSRATRTR